MKSLFSAQVRHLTSYLLTPFLLKGVVDSPLLLLKFFFRTLDFSDKQLSSIPLSQKTLVQAKEFMQSFVASVSKTLIYYICGEDKFAL